MGDHGAARIVLHDHSAEVGATFVNGKLVERPGESGSDQRAAFRNDPRT